MTNDTYDPVPILVIAGDKAVEDSLLRQLSLWAEARCVRFHFQPWQEADACRPDPVPSILFLYLRRGDSSLIQAPAWLEGVLSSCAVVILSEDQIQAIQAYQWHPSACLSTGYSYDELCQAMDRCFRYWRQGLAWLDMPFQWDRVRVPLSQVHYAEGQGRDTILHCTGGEIRVSVPLSKLEAELPAPPFIRCQKSFIVHPDAVEHMGGNDLIMKDRMAITVSRNRKKEVRQLLEQWRRDRGNGT